MNIFEKIEALEAEKHNLYKPLFRGKKNRAMLRDINDINERLAILYKNKPSDISLLINQS